MYCRNNPCLNGGVCAPTKLRGYSCECPPTHYGTECQMIDGCFDNPCLNGGICMRTKEGFLLKSVFLFRHLTHTFLSGFICHCTTGFFGKTCSFTNQCNSNSCLNGGTCRNVNGSFSCL